MRTDAVIFTAPGTAELQAIELPDPRPQDLVVETLVSGVSAGTERWALLARRPEMRFPLVPGYMGIARVVEAGAEARAAGWKPGMVVNHAGSRLPQPHAANSWMGAHMAYAVVDPTPIPPPHAFHRCAEVPEGVDPVAASLSQLAAVALRGLNMITVRPNDTVLVLGLGVIGQFAAQISRLLGARVMATDLVAGRCATARATGIDLVVEGGVDAVKAQAGAFAPGGFDIIIDTASIPAVVNAAVPLLRVGGTVVFQGWYPPPSPLDLDAFHQRLPTCVFPCGHTTPSVEAAQRWIRDGKLDARSLVGAVVRPSEAPALYARLAAGADALVGAAIDWRKP